MTSEIAKLIGFSRSLPGVCTFVTPIFKTASGVISRQEVEDSRVKEFLPISVSEEFTPVEFPLATQSGDEAVYGFEYFTDDFLVGSRAGLCKVLSHTVISSPDAVLGPQTRAAISRFMDCPVALQTTNAPVFRCSKMSDSGGYVIASYGLTGMDQVIAAAKNESSAESDQKMIPQEVALLLSVIPLNKEVSTDLMLNYFSRFHQITKSEEGVLKILCAGYSAPQIADQLQLAVSTVRSHVRSLCFKTGSTGVRDLVGRITPLIVLAAAGGYMHEYRLQARESALSSTTASLPVEVSSDGVVLTVVSASNAAASPVGVTQAIASTRPLASQVNASLNIDAITELVSSITRETAALTEKISAEANVLPEDYVASEAARLAERSRSSKARISEIVKTFHAETETAISAVETSAAELSLAALTHWEEARDPFTRMQRASQQLQHLNSRLMGLVGESETTAAVAAKVHEIFAADLVATAGGWDTVKKMAELSRYSEHWSRSLARLTS